MADKMKSEEQIKPRHEPAKKARKVEEARARLPRAVKKEAAPVSSRKPQAKPTKAKPPVVAKKVTARKSCGSAAPRMQLATHSTKK